MFTPHRKFAVIDPRLFEGNPFDVAERAAGQVAGLVDLALEATESGMLMARNAELERQCLADVTLDAYGWANSAEGKRWQKVYDELSRTKKSLEILKKAAAFDPRTNLK